MYIEYHGSNVLFLVFYQTLLFTGVSQHINNAIILGIPFFATCEAEALQDLVSALNPAGKKHLAVTRMGDSMGLSHSPLLSHEIIYSI